jgi:tetratricopeptide (TPR) repeat protein
MPVSSRILPVMIGLRKRPLAIFVLGPVALLALAACGGMPAQQATDLVSQGLKAQLYGDLATAASDYKKAIQLDSGDKFAHYDLGTVYGQPGNKALGEQEYDTVQTIDPNLADAIYNLAVNSANSNLPFAEQLYRQVIALQPGWAAAWSRLRAAERGERGEAKVDWAKAVSLDPTLASRIPTPAASPSPSGSASRSPTPAP